MIYGTKSIVKIRNAPAKENRNTAVTSRPISGPERGVVHNAHAQTVRSDRLPDPVDSHWR